MKGCGENDIVSSTASLISSRLPSLSFYFLFLFFLFFFFVPEINEGDVSLRLEFFYSLNGFRFELRGQKIKDELMTS